MTKKSKKATVKVVKTAPKHKKEPKHESRVGAAKFLQDNRALVSGGLDAASLLPIPYAGTIRNGIRALTGFSDRRVVVGGGSETQGGPVVETADAPTAFARNQITSFSTVGDEKDGKTPFRTCNMVGAISTAAAGAFSVSTANRASPANTSLFPANYFRALNFNKFRIIKLFLHYCHFAPTSVQSAIMLTYVPTPDPADVALQLTTSSLLMAQKFSAMGSAYEDFSLEITDPVWNKDTWFDCYAGAPSAAAGDIPNAPGCVTWAVENGTAVASVGYIYCEIIGEYCDERPYYAGVGLLAETALVVKHCQDEDKTRLVDGVLAVLRRDLLYGDMRKDMNVSKLFPRLLEPPAKRTGSVSRG